MLVEAQAGGFGRGDAGVAAVGTALADPAVAKAVAAAIAASDDFLLVKTADVADLLVADPESVAASSAAAVVVLGSGSGLALRAPVRAILPAAAPPALVVAALRLVAAGLTVAPAGPEGRRLAGEDAEGGLPRLTPRETEVLRLLADGASNKIIARRLDISVHTAKFHVASVLQKLQASGRLEAVGIGLRSGLLML